MTSVIESDLIFSKTAHQTGRKARLPTSGAAGEAFARTLLQGGELAAQTGSIVPDAQSSGTVQTFFTLPTPPAESESDTPEDIASQVDVVPLPAAEILPETDDIERAAAERADVEVAALEQEASEARDDIPEEVAIPLPAAPPSPAIETSPARATVELGQSTQETAQAVQPQTRSQTTTDAPQVSHDTPPAAEVQALAVQATGSDTSQPTRTRNLEGGSPRKTITPVQTPDTPAISETAPQQALAPVNTKAPSSETRDATFSPEAGLSSDIARLDHGPGTRNSKISASTTPAPDSAVILPTAPAPVQSVQTLQPNQPQLQMTPTHALVTASPANTVKIISDAAASPDDMPDRITVQLDPPELGRVSIDFKFDAHGLQHVTVTGETPEAMRQLRLMHFELTQALERGGLSSQNMTFQQQSGHQQEQTPTPARLFDTNSSADSSLLVPTATAAETLRPAHTAGGGLDIRL